MMSEVNDVFGGFFRSIFVGDGPYKEIIEVLVDNLGKIYDVLKDRRIQDKAANISPFVKALNEQRRKLSIEKAEAIADEFAERIEGSFVFHFLKLNKHQCGLPASKWEYIYFQMLGILKPSLYPKCDGSCKKCSGKCEGCKK